MICINNVQQGSDEWMRLRAGSPGASSFDKIVTTKGEPSKSRTDYLYQLAGERIIGTCEDGFSNYHMERGIALENEWRGCFELVTGLTIHQVAIVYADDRKRFHCSPDGLIDGMECGIEGKAPMLKTAVKYLLGNKLPTEYFCQVQGSMYVCGFSRYYFMSYYPGLAPLILKVERDEKWISKFSVALNEFCDELDFVTEQLRKAA